MDKQSVTFDPIWEEKYAAGHVQNYPWDMVVFFVFRNIPRDLVRSQKRLWKWALARPQIFGSLLEKVSRSLGWREAPAQLILQ